MADAKKGNMISILAHTRRVFVDLRESRGYEQWINSISDEQDKKRFAYGLATILANYPENVNAEKEKVHMLLSRLASLSGVLPSAQPGWFTDVKGRDNTSSMLSICHDNNWYNFLACDEYMMLEQRRPSTKHIIGLYGRAESGKTPTARLVFKMLKENYPEHAIMFEDEDKYDVKGLFYIGNAKVGFDSQGDPTGRQMDSLNDFVKMDCDVIMISSRTDGRTVNAIEKFERNHIIDWQARQIRDNKDEHELVNIQQAEELFRLINQYATIV